LDEVRFEQHGTRCRMWIPPEDRDPVLLHPPTKKSVAYYGAVRLRDGRFVYRRCETRFNGGTFFEFMRYLRQVTAPATGRTVVIADNARYHHAVLHEDWREACADRFALHFLPPYSPELNPIERVWKLTRRTCTHNRYFPSLDGITESVETKFDEWRHGSEALRRLCAIT